jgi:cytochrome c553
VAPAVRVRDVHASDRPIRPRHPRASTVARGHAWRTVLLAFALALPLPLLAFSDTMAQRLLACTGCHGQDGRAEGDVFFPRIAGKPAGYLFNQLRNFRDGHRSYALMGNLLALLDDRYLQEIADYFAGLSLPYPPPAPLKLSREAMDQADRLVHQGDPARRIPACTTCHGAALTGVQPHVPGLLGLPRDYVNAQLGAWKTGQRRAQAPDCMAHVARALKTDEVSALGAWLSAQPLPSQPRAVARVPAAAPGVRPACGSAPELGGSTP